jgi:DNA-binding XRE family transcriptional regulator
MITWKIEFYKDLKGKEAIMDWKTAKKRLIEADPQLQIELDKLDLKYKVLSQVIELRRSHKITQLELAERINDRQSNIARLENGNANPSIEKLQKIAEALDSNLEIRFIPKASH